MFDAPSGRGLRRRSLVGAALGAVSVRSRAAGRPLVVAQVASLSGRNGADLGLGLKAGIEACFSSVNASGGVRGQMLRLLSRDDAYVPEATVRLTRELIARDRPVALIGYRGTANTIALIESRVLPDNGITLVGSLTGAREVQGAPGLLNLRTPYEREVSELVRQIQRMTMDSLSVLYADDAFGRTGLAAVQRAVAATGIELTGTAAYDKSPDRIAQSVAEAAATLAATPTKAIIMVAVGDPVYAFVKAFRPLAPSTRLFCMSVVDAAQVVAHCGPRLAAGVGFSQVFPYPYAPVSPLVRDYRRALAQLAGSPPANYFSLEGYVYARVLVEAMKRAPDAPTPFQLSAAIDAMPPLDLGGLRVNIDRRNRNGLQFTDLTVLNGTGKLVA
jgi:branched-chain amino acid transport system substrate-binding protein